MKNFLKRKRSKAADAETSSSRITNETVAEHREQVLAGGRRFKYPLQYQKHKLVVNSIIIGVAAITLLTILGWQQLYVAQNSSKLMYRITQILPVSAATIDGESVRYSDYLMRYRSSLYYAQKQDSINLGSHDGQCQAAYYQRQELTNAERGAYVTKLARELRVTVQDDEVSSFIKQDIDARAVSLNAYEKTVLNNYYDWSLDEYRSIVKTELLKRKVSFTIDTTAKDKATSLLEGLKGGADFAKTATTSSDDDVTKVNGGDSGVMPVSSLDSNGLVAAAQTLQPNQTSELIKGIDGYYIIQLISKDAENVHYRMIKVALTEFDKRFAALTNDKKIKEYIRVDRADCQQATASKK